MLLKGKEEKLPRQSTCNICSVCNRNVSNDCTVSNVPGDLSVVNNVKIVGSNIVRSVSSVSNISIVYWVKVKNPIPPMHQPTRWSTHHRHTTGTSANTLSTRRPTHYRCVGRHTTDTSV